MMRIPALATSVALFFLTACATAPETAEGKADIRHDADRALAAAKRADPSLDGCLRNSAGYAVFPHVGKGGAGVGGAYGKGVLYEEGRATGYCDVSQASVGLQLGGQTFTEIVCFEHEKALDEFKSGKVVFDANTSAVALEAGAGGNATYEKGIEVFTTNEQGMMVEAAIGGQKFTYRPL